MNTPTTSHGSEAAPLDRSQSPAPSESCSVPARPADRDFKERIELAHETAGSVLIANGMAPEKIECGDVRVPSVLYMTYWYHRMRNNPEEQARIQEHLYQYVGSAVSDTRSFTNSLLSDEVLKTCATSFVEQLLLPTRTVDLVVTRSEGEGVNGKYVLCHERAYYPLGPALPGGIISDGDEGNPLGVSAQLFAAMRVAGEKILGGGPNLQYLKEHDDRGRFKYVVSEDSTGRAVIIHAEDDDGFHFRENIRTVLRPSDPRHIVDTMAYRCELKGEPGPGLYWRSRADVLSPESPQGKFAFNHHRDIVTHLIARSSVESELSLRERDFVRAIIADPLSEYTKLAEQLTRHKVPQMASMPQLFPVVNRLLTAAYSPDINKLCEQQPVLAGIRDKATIALRQVCLKNRTFCPYLPTLNAVAQGVAFFDVVARQKQGFYEMMDKERITEHNPATTKFASYHMYRYKYRLDELLCKVPGEILIPTFESLSATDLMRVRGVPIRFIGLSTDFLYVDEFLQSPEEFMMHDANHSWRMVSEDEKCKEIYGMSRAELTQESIRFSREYLDRIKISPTDSEEVRELKKLKKIILFEIVHEDARPFLKEVICKYIQQKEGGLVPFEVPHVDPATGYMDTVDTLDTGISTLSYVRNKLQHGFYDHVDAQMPQIVAPKYRTSEWIATAAYEMLVELDATPAQHAELDEKGRVSREWLLKRVCSVGPDNIHESKTEDPALEAYGDGGEKLNPKRYQA